MDEIPAEGFNAALTLTDTLDHLPATKKREIARVLEILFDEVEKFQSTKLSNRKNQGRVLKVILFGSYARGDWVEDRSSGYRSDYDLMIVVNPPSFAAEDDLWFSLDDRLIQAQIANHIKTPVVAVVHSLHEVNDELARGRPFFIDVARDGKMLYETEGFPLVEPKPLTAEAAQEEGRTYFEQWMPLATSRLDLAQTAMDRAYLRDAAFDLHQATERLYHCLLLTLTLYSPKLHRVKVLRSRAEDLDHRLIAAWPRDNRKARARFELLSRAYVEARYSSKYRIKIEELQWMLDRVKALQAIVTVVCQEHFVASSK